MTRGGLVFACFVAVAASLAAGQADAQASGVRTECTQASLACTEGLKGITECLRQLLTTNKCCTNANTLDKCLAPLGDAGAACEGVGSVDLGLAAPLLEACKASPRNAEQVGAVLPGVRLPENVIISEDCVNRFSPCKSINVQTCADCCAAAERRVACYQDNVAACDNEALTASLSAVEPRVATAKDELCGVTPTPVPSEATPTPVPSSGDGSEDPSSVPSSDPSTDPSSEPSSDPSEAPSSGGGSSSASPSATPSAGPEAAGLDCQAAIDRCSTRFPVDVVCANGGQDCCDRLTERVQCKAEIDLAECRGQERQSQDALLNEVSEEDSDCSGVCFPGGATVQLEGGATRRMDELEWGDRVLTSSGEFQGVFFFSHRLAGKRSTFVEVSTAAGRTLRLSPSHLIPTARRGTVAARDLLAHQDEVFVSSGAGRAAAASAVTSTPLVADAGLFNPHTAAHAAASVVVDGVVASQFTTAVDPRAAAALLRPVEWAYRMAGVAVRLPPAANRVFAEARAATSHIPALKYIY